MKWSILVLTQEHRDDFLDRLLLVLGPQVAEFHEKVELLIRTYDPQLTLGKNRQMLINDAQGEYLNFVDDDDMVPFDYVRKILPELGPTDMIGFQVQQWDMGKTLGVKSFHTLESGEWRNEWEGHEPGRYRDISHLNPIRSKIARKATFDGGMGEDVRWARHIRSLGLVKTQTYIPQVMYLYDYRSNKEPIP